MSRKKEMGRGANGTGSIRKITSTRNGKEYTYWQARYTAGYDPGTGKQIQRSITGKTQKEVAQKLKQATYELDQGTYNEPCRMTVKDWLEIWKAEYTGGCERVHRIHLQEKSGYVCYPVFGSRQAGILTAPMVQSLYNRLLKPETERVKALSAKSVRNVHGVLHKALQQAVLVGYIRNNPADACKPPRAEKKEVCPLDESKVADFLKAIQDHPHEYLYKITLFTGLREGEVLGLTWDCLDFEHGTLLIKQQLLPGTAKRRQILFLTAEKQQAPCFVPRPSVVRLFRCQKLKAELSAAGSRGAMDRKQLDFHQPNRRLPFLSYRV